MPRASQPDYVFTVKVAMLEIYNEDVRDLLVETPGPATGGGGGGGDGGADVGKLEIRRDQDGRVQARYPFVLLLMAISSLCSIFVFSPPFFGVCEVDECGWVWR